LALEAARRGKTRLPYTAKAGDTLAKIARRYGLAPGDLARINRLSSTSDLSEGQTVVVDSPTPELPREVPAAPTTPPQPPRTGPPADHRARAPPPARKPTQAGGAPRQGGGPRPSGGWRPSRWGAASRWARPSPRAR